jgi:hypothetical protein
MSSEAIQAALRLGVDVYVRGSVDIKGRHVLHVGSLLGAYTFPAQELEPIVRAAGLSNRFSGEPLAVWLLSRSTHADYRIYTLEVHRSAIMAYVAATAPEILDAPQVRKHTAKPPQRRVKQQRR